MVKNDENFTEKDLSCFGLVFTPCFVLGRLLACTNCVSMLNKRVWFLF